MSAIEPNQKKTGLKKVQSTMMLLPKYLIRFSIVLFFLSFVYMVYVLNNDEYYNDFMSQSGDHDFESMTSLHPLFQFLQHNYDPSTRFRQ